MSQYGHRLLPNFIDEVASSDPNLLFVQTPKSPDLEDGLHQITFSDLSRAINRCAWWIEQNLGKGHGFPSLAYIGPHDLRYLFLVFGACKAGYKMFFGSPRNSILSLLDLLDDVDCSVILRPDAPMFSKLLDSVTAERPMQTLQFPDLDYFLNTHSVLAYPWRKTFEEGKNDPLAVFHTSGSTGTPKLITVNHGAVASLDAFRKIPGLSGEMIQTSLHTGKKTFLLFPMFHASALSTLFLSIWNLIPTMLPPAVPLTAELASDMLSHFDIEASIMPPSILADIAANPQYLKNLWECHSVMYGGGPLPTEAGDKIASGTDLITVFGSSETGFFPVEIMEREEWSYVKLSPFAGGVHQQYTRDLYELVIERRPELAEYQPVFWTYPDLDTYHTKDLFSKHPAKPDLWLWQGRIDDIIVLSNGEKFNPVTMEELIRNHPAIESALVCGQGRVQCALLVELSSSESSEDDKSEEEVVEELWPVVEEANKSCPEYGRLMKDMVIIAKQGKKMVRADKGTVQRKRTLEHFSTELDQLYRLRQVLTTSNSGNHCLMDRGAIEKIITQIVQEISRYESIQPGASLFDLGLDSLHAMTIARSIKAAFPESRVSITTKTIYDFPSIEKLASLVCGTLYQDATGEMQKMYEKHAHKLDKSHTTQQTGAVVLLTGSTGHLGSQLLRKLMLDANVCEIHCLNRRTSASEENAQQIQTLNLPTPKPMHNILIDYSLPHLGITEEKWRDMQKQITHVIHNAWPVDFCKPLSQFENSIASISTLVDFCVEAKRHVEFVSVSSIGSVLKNPGSHVPEEVVRDWHAAETMGYTQSKLIAECLLASASTSFGVKTTICRLGQLGGSLDPDVCKWPEKEWVPGLLMASQRMGVLPSTLGTLDAVDWLPVDVAAAAVLDIAFSAHGTRELCRVFNVVNPVATKWETLIPLTRDFAGLEKVSFADWVARLKDTVERKDVDLGAAVGLIEFFEGLCREYDKAPSVDVSKAVALSSALANCQSISKELMEQWASQWDFEL